MHIASKMIELTLSKISNVSIYDIRSRKIRFAYMYFNSKDSRAGSTGIKNSSKFVVWIVHQTKTGL